MIRKKWKFIAASVLVLTCSCLLLRSHSRPDLSVVGYIHLADGLGRQGPELLDAFKSTLKVNFIETRKIKGAINPKNIKKHIIKKPKKQDWGKVVVYEDILWGPWDTNIISTLNTCPKDALKIAYSMTESTKIPQEWVQILNNKFDAVVVPSQFLVNVFQECGVQTPIFVIPLGLDLKKFFKQPLKQGLSEKMVFGNFSAGSDRKNHVTLIRAFNLAFGDDPNVELRINVRYAEKEVRNEITKELSKLNSKNILFTQKTLSKKDYLNEFKKIDCYVSASKGEGFSIQPREAMALGIPVIATNNTGQTDICQTGLVKTVQSPIQELAVNPWGDYYGHNFNCTVEDLANALIEVRNNYSTYLNNGIVSREWAKQFQYKNLISEYAMLIKPRKVILGKENSITSTHLVANSKFLLKKYRKLFGNDITTVDNEIVFNYIYETGEWGKNETGEGFSGEGSLPQYASPYMEYLSTFIKKNNINSVVDLGCGDWTFSRCIDWKDINYIGIDVVKFLVDRNNEQFGRSNIKFIHADGIDYNLPSADLLICKDVLQHLSTADVNKVLKQIGKFKHCLFTNDVDPKTQTSQNIEIPSGWCRELDLTKSPFNLYGEKVLFYDSGGTHKMVLHIKK